VKGVGETFSSQAINIRSGRISGLAEKMISLNAFAPAKWGPLFGVWGIPTIL